MTNLNSWIISVALITGLFGISEVHAKTIKYENGSVYIGDTEGGLPSGSGMLTLANGAVKDGLFFEGDYAGKDSTIHNKEKANGEKLNMEYYYFLQDVAFGEYTGKGNYYDSTGRGYIGDYVNGKKHGRGEFTWSSGKKYIGGWKNGKRHGQGIITRADGTVFTDVWDDGIRQKLESPSQTIQTGTLSYNSKTGVITDMAPGGKTYLGWSEVLLWNPKYDAPESSSNITSGYHIATQAEARVFIDAAGVDALIKREVLNEDGRPEIEVINIITKSSTFVFGAWDSRRNNAAQFKSDTAGRYGLIRAEDFDSKENGKATLVIRFDTYGLPSEATQYFGNNLKFDPYTPPFATWLLVAD